MSAADFIFTMPPRRAAPDLTMADVTAVDLDNLTSDSQWRPCEVNVGPEKCSTRAEWVAYFRRQCDHPSPGQRLMCAKHRKEGAEKRIVCGVKRCDVHVVLTYTEALR